MKLCNPRPYPALHKARAFLRGLPHSPLVELAREGIQGGRALSPAHEFKYALRLAEHGTSRFLCEVLLRGASETVQGIFASALRERFEERLRFISLISYALWEDGHSVSSFREACRPDALGLARLRARVSRALASGNVTSGTAQRDLVPLLREYNILDNHFGPSVPGLGGHEVPILASPAAPEDLKKLVLREMADSRSITSRGLLGLPLTPYDHM